MCLFLRFFRGSILQYQKKYSVIHYVNFFYTISAWIQLRCNPSCEISKRGSFREKHVARNFHYGAGELHGGSRVSSEKRVSDDFPDLTSDSGVSPLCRTNIIPRRASLFQRILMAATGMRNTAVVGVSGPGNGVRFLFQGTRASEANGASAVWQRPGLTRARFYSDLSGFYQVSPTWLAAARRSSRERARFHPFWARFSSEGLRGKAASRERRVFHEF